MSNGAQKVELIKSIAAAIATVQIVDKWFQQLVLVYIEMQRAKDNAEFLNAVQKAKSTQDVEDLAANLGRKL